MECYAIWAREHHHYLSKMMDKVFKDWKNPILKVFVDDVNIHSLNWKDHM